jgi:hypothetical protein
MGHTHPSATDIRIRPLHRDPTTEIIPQHIEVPSDTHSKPLNILFYTCLILIGYSIWACVKIWSLVVADFFRLTPVIHRLAVPNLVPLREHQRIEPFLKVVGKFKKLDRLWQMLQTA